MIFQIIREEDFDAIYNAIIAQQAFSYQDLFSRFSEKQKKCCWLLRKKNNFITDINGRKTITDLIFKDWLRQN